MSQIPADLLYAETHEWLRIEPDGTAVVGITDHAQAELTDVVYVELPKIGATLEAGKQATVVESVKAASDIYAPASGEVLEVNSKLEADPGLLNRDPFGEGWILKMKLAEPTAPAHLKNAEGYRAQLGE